MSKPDWSNLSKWLPDAEISVTVAEFTLRSHRFPFEIEVRIREYPNGKYLGFSNLSFWGPRQASPYKSLHFTDTQESALIDLIGGIERLQDAKDSQRYVFWVKEDPTDPGKSVYFDGTGARLTDTEVQNRRSEWHKNPHSSP